MDAGNNSSRQEIGLLRGEEIHGLSELRVAEKQAKDTIV